MTKCQALFRAGYSQIRHSPHPREAYSALGQDTKVNMQLGDRMSADRGGHKRQSELTGAQTEGCGEAKKPPREDA